MQVVLPSLRGVVQWLAPLILLLAVWEWLTYGDQRARFLFGAPSLVGVALWTELLTGRLVEHTLITSAEAIAGFVLGSFGGSLVGLGLLFSRRVGRISRPYVLAIGSVPVFAIAPMTVIWFGTGFFAKVMLAALSTLFVAVVQAYEGGRQADERYIGMLRTFGASRLQVFSKVVAPSTVFWVVASCKLNAGFALLGAFIGEFISSDRGLGHYVLRASSLYDVPNVLAGVVCMMVVSASIAGSVSGLATVLVPWGGSGRAALAVE